MGMMKSLVKKALLAAVLVVGRRVASRLVGKAAQKIVKPR
jgi:hypothetical protein